MSNPYKPPQSVVSSAKLNAKSSSQPSNYRMRQFIISLLLLFSLLGLFQHGYALWLINNSDAFLPATILMVEREIPAYLIAWISLSGVFHILLMLLAFKVIFISKKIASYYLWLIVIASISMLINTFYFPLHKVIYLWVIYLIIYGFSFYIFKKMITP